MAALVSGRALRNAGFFVSDRHARIRNPSTGWVGDCSLQTRVALQGGITRREGVVVQGRFVGLWVKAAVWGRGISGRRA